MTSNRQDPRAEDGLTTATCLGTGTSVGVPVIGCDCAVCTSKHPANIRTRCSLHLQSPAVSLLIDTGPDLREQCLRENIRTVDAVLYTHAHLDHLAGFDELRAFCWRRDDPLPIYAGRETHEALRRMFPWAMKNTRRSYVRPAPRVLDGPFTLGDLEVIPIPVEHAGIETFGFRFNLPGDSSLAYLPDVKHIPEASLDLLANLEVLIIDALRPAPHPTHLSLDESLAAATALRPRHTLFTHIAHEIDFTETSRTLPPGFSLACDGLKVLFKENSRCSMIEPSTLMPE